MHGSVGGGDRAPEAAAMTACLECLRAEIKSLLLDDELDDVDEFRLTARTFASTVRKHATTVVVHGLFTRRCAAYLVSGRGNLIALTIADGERE